MKNCFDLLACLPWFEFKPALFWRKIYIARITMPQFLIVSAENWVRIYNINVAYPDRVFCDVLGIPKVPLGHSGAFLLVRAILGGKWSIRSPPGCPKRPRSGPKCLILMYFIPVKCFGVIWSFLVHHLRRLAISSSRTLLFDNPEVVPLTG